MVATTMAKVLLVSFSLVLLLSSVQAMMPAGSATAMLVEGDQVASNLPFRKRFQNRNNIEDAQIEAIKQSEMSHASAAVDSVKATATVVESQVVAAPKVALEDKSKAAGSATEAAEFHFTDHLESEQINDSSVTDEQSEQTEVEDNDEEKAENDQQPENEDILERDHEGDSDADRDGDHEEDSDRDNDNDRHDDAVDQDSRTFHRKRHHKRHHHRRFKDSDTDSETDPAEYMKYEVGGVNYMPKIVKRRLCLKACTANLVQDRPHCENYYKFYFVHKHLLKSCHKHWVRCAFHHCGGTTKFIEPA